jgi:presenilin-like A22 family membrane protease
MTAILVGMFIITQLIGLFVVGVYNDGLELPYGMEPPAEIEQAPNQAGSSILIAFVIAIAFFFILIKLNAESFIRLWFYGVTTIAMALTFTALFFTLNLNYNPTYLALIIALPLAYIKIFKRHILTHNITELLIYPGIAAVFVAILTPLWMIILILVMSLYDIWAVWQTSFMKKMANFQINQVKIFGGFFVPYADKKQKQKIKLIKEKYQEKGEGTLEKQFKKAKIKVNLAILGGGDVIFPIIAAGVFLKYYGILPALTITLAATLALLLLFLKSKKGKFYPAMPFLTIGMYLGMIVSWLVF